MPWEYVEKYEWIITKYWNPRSWLNEGYWVAELSLPNYGIVSKGRGDNKNMAVRHLVFNSEKLLKSDKSSILVKPLLNAFISKIRQHEDLLKQNAIDMIE